VLGISLFAIVSRPVLELTQPPGPVGTRGSFLGVKRPGREADHSPPSNADVKYAWSFTSTPPVRPNWVVLGLKEKAQGQLTLYNRIRILVFLEDIDYQFFK